MPAHAKRSLHPHLENCVHDSDAWNEVFLNDSPLTFLPAPPRPAPFWGALTSLPPSRLHLAKGTGPFSPQKEAELGGGMNTRIDKPVLLAAG